MPRRSLLALAALPALTLLYVVLGLGLGAILFAWCGLALTGFAVAVLPIRRLLVPMLCVAVALGWLSGGLVPTG